MNTIPIVLSPLDAVLNDDGELLAAWERLPPSHQWKWIRSIEDVKCPETRQRHATRLRKRLPGS